MAWLKGYTWRPIAPGSNDPPIIPVGMVFHVSGGRGNSLYNYFNGPSGGIESHFYIRYDGTGEQYRDTEWEADAQGSGNSWVAGGVRYGLISVETEGICGEQWTPQQLATLRQLMMQCHDLHSIPFRVCPTEHSAGYGYHALFPGWNINNHACPCPERIVQFRNVLMGSPLDPSTLNTPPIVRPLKGDTMIYVTEDNLAYGPTGNPATLTRLPAGPSATGDGNYHDFLGAGVPVVRVSRKELTRRGFKLVDINDKVVV